MKHITILVPYHSVLASVDDSRYLLLAVNQFLIKAKHKALFDIHLAGLSKNVKLHEGRYTVHTDSLIRQIKKTDLIFIPALMNPIEETLQSNQDFIPWIIDQHKNGAELASLCGGAFLLASTGLLNGGKCSTHWTHSNTFRKKFPEVELVDDKIITVQGGIYSSGGANSYWNLLLYLIEKYTTREMAILAVKYFAIEIDRKNQLPFMIFQGQNDHHDETIKAVQSYLEQHYSNDITVDKLCNQFSIARRSLERRFKKATNNTIIEYLQRVKIESAKKMLESSYASVQEVMYEVGYSDTKAFRSLFKKITGITPVEYPNKFNKDGALWV